MTDIWYTFGAMVADPGFFPVIAKVNPKFTLISMQVSENGVSASRRAAGYLDGDSTTALRRAFRDYVAKLAQPAPVISLYTAAKFCQLWHTLDRFSSVFTLANGAFVKAGGLKTSSVAMLTAMGISLLDGQVATAFRAGGLPLPGDNLALTAEFGLQPAELKTLQTWLNDPDFNAAQATLMSAACWTDAPCLEDFIFYDGFKRAVN
jgi:hypothetical protein